MNGLPRLFFLAITMLPFAGCQLIADKIFSPPTEDSSGCVGEACKDVPNVRESGIWKWTNRGNKKIALRIPNCENGFNEKFLEPGEEYRAGTQCNPYEAYYGNFPSRGSVAPPVPIQPNNPSEKEIFTATYDDPTYCFITPFSSDIYVRLFYERRSGGKGDIIKSEFLLKIGDDVRVDTFGGRFVVDYRYSKSNAWNENNNKGFCRDGNKVKLP
ncbi:MAG: hypothetical protein WBD27_07210 [Pyrinomonadaceae bacterium]